MHYGILKHIGFAKDGEVNNRLISLGDIFECLAVRNIYNQMGIANEELMSCNQYDLEDYNGEYIVLPINIYSLNVNYSRRVLPCFLGLTIGGIQNISERNINMLRRFQPIGCRDERTMRKLIEDYGIDAYLQGCLVATFPERKQNLSSQKKVFFVDPNAGIKDYIPKELLENYEFFSHDFYVTSEDELCKGGIYEFGEKAIEKYSNEARLIITSKYHAAIIALALGIPVILIMENNYYKYSWISKFIPVYEPKDFDKINWNPPIVKIPQEEKELMIKIAMDRIKATYSKYKDICTLSEIRENIETEEFEDIFYGSYAIEYIKKNWSKDIEIQYVFWGATDTSRRLNKFISENYKGAKLKKVYDWVIKTPVQYAEGEFYPDSLDGLETEEAFVFVTGNSASLAAKELFEKTGKKNYYLCERKVLKESDLYNEEENMY